MKIFSRRTSVVMKWMRLMLLSWLAVSVHGIYRNTITEIAIFKPELSILVELLVLADLAGALDDEYVQYNVFAPTNRAFQSLGEDVLNSLYREENLEKLKAILLYHVIGDTVIYSDDLALSNEYVTLLGESVKITSLYPPKVNDANIIELDIHASNGVIHIINDVLLPTLEPDDDYQPPAEDDHVVVLPPLVIKGNDGKPPGIYPLGLCEGDCDYDHDCKDGLVCFDVGTATTVPGCSGRRKVSESGKKVDYCFDPSVLRDDDYTPTTDDDYTPTTDDGDDAVDDDYNDNGLPHLVYKGDDGEPAELFPLDICQGDCDSDLECKGGLKCFDHDSSSIVPGCKGTRKIWNGKKVDYCYDPSNDNGNHYV